MTTWIKFVLATDLDGTFLHGETSELYEFIEEQRDNILLVFLTGRSVEASRNVLENANVPTPDVLVSDVGATIVHGHSLQPFTSIQEIITKEWPGEEPIRERLQDFPGIEYQSTPQCNRVSYYTEPWAKIEELKNIVNEAFGCHCIYSHGCFFDILPPGVSKGSTLELILEASALPHDRVLVAGNTLNDLALFETGCPGVVVANSEDSLKEKLTGLSQIYLAQQVGAAGIVEGLKNFGFWSEG